MNMSMPHVRSITRLLLIVVVVTLSGCTGGDSDLRDWIAQQKANKGAPIPPLPELKRFESFEYQYKDNDPDVRDPFGVSARERQEATANAHNGPQPDQHPKEPLEGYPLDSLKMVGTLNSGPAMEALMKDPEGVVHRVHMRNYMGQNNGKVTAIAEDHIELVELIPNGTGGWTEHLATVALGEK
jgi:type IV pilus assembly protein PilP